jgi:hypothetical protein
VMAAMMSFMTSFMMLSMKSTMMPSMMSSMTTKMLLRLFFLIILKLFVLFMFIFKIASFNKFWVTHFFIIYLILPHFSFITLIKLYATLY